MRCNVYPNYFSLHCKTLSFVDDFKKFIYSNKICMAINTWEMPNDLSWKDAASSTGGITRSSVNII